MTQSLLERAAACDSRDLAASLILAVLHIEGEAVARATLPDPERWQALPVPNRLQELASWLTAECHACVDRNECIGL